MSTLSSASSSSKQSEAPARQPEQADGLSTANPEQHTTWRVVRENGEDMPVYLKVDNSGDILFKAYTKPYELRTEAQVHSHVICFF